MTRELDARLFAPPSAMVVASPPPTNEAIVTSGAETVGLWQVAPWRT